MIPVTPELLHIIFYNWNREMSIPQVDGPKEVIPHIQSYDWAKVFHFEMFVS